MRISDWSSDVCSSDLVERQRRERLDDHWRRACPRSLEIRRPFQVVGCDDPGAFRLPLDEAAEAAHGLEPAHMRLGKVGRRGRVVAQVDRSEEHTSELQSLMRISYAVCCLKKKINKHNNY